MKNLFFCVIIILTTSAVQAQYRYLDYGIRGNVGLSSLEGSSKLGVSLGAGLFVNVDIFDRVGLGVDILPGLKTGKYEEIAGATTTTHKYSFFVMDIVHYVYFPFSEHISFEIGKNLTSLHLSEKYIIDGKKQEGFSTTDALGGMLVGLKIQLSSSSEIGVRYISSKITDGVYLNGGSSGVVSFTYAQDINW
ncbi:MAG: hypothetical protein OEW67_00800 [Cyclobacteriaceae bacterium]|nr:hypothetical protein [Cyclobacteriaceae bacterium]